MRRSLAYLICLFVLSIDVSAQQYKFNNLGVEDGLSQSTVYAVEQDLEGFIWIATRDGLNKYDAAGIEIIRPNSQSINGLANQSIRTIRVDNQNGLWIGTDGGGLQYLEADRQTFRTYTDADSSEFILSGNSVISFELSENEIWVGSRNHGLTRVSRADYSSKFFLEGENIWALYYSEATKTLWIGTDSGLYSLTAEKDLTKQLDAGINAFAHYEDRLYAGASNGLIYEFKNGEFSEIDLGINSSVNTLAVYQEQLWVGTSNDGVIIYNPENSDSEKLQAANDDRYSLTENAIRSLYVDKKNTIWLGTNTSGLDYYSPTRYKFDLIRKSNASNVILSFAEWTGDQVLVGRERAGLSLYDLKNQFESDFKINGQNVFDNYSVVDVLVSEAGILWVATDGMGLYRYDHRSSKLMQITENTGLSNNSVLTLLETSDGDIWAGTYQGLNQLDEKGKILKTYSSEFNSGVMLDDRILSLYEHNNGEIWFGTSQEGLYSIDKEGTVKRFLDQPNHIQAIVECSAGYIWLGSYDGVGRYQLESNSLTMITTEDGLPNNVVYGIVEDSSNDLWLSTNSGIVRIDHELFSPVNYTTSDGLQSNEFNGGAYHKLSDGKILFGGINGFNLIDPLAFPIDSSTSKTQVTDFILSGESTDFDENQDKIKLRYNQNFFSFEFTNLDYVAPEKQQFKYRLIGLDDDWVFSGNRREAIYTSVPPGKYWFVAQGTNADGVWGSLSKQIPVVISRPYWATWWFYLLVLSAVIISFYTIYRYRLYHITRLQTTRNSIASDLHDEVSATLSSISFFAEAIERKEQLDQSNRFVHLIRESAVDAKEKISDIIWAVNPENDDWDELLVKCRRYSSDLFESKGIQYHIDFDQNINAKPDLELKQQFWLIFKEIIMNAARHSKATKVNISAKQNGSALIFAIQDDGFGFDMENVELGNGLKSIHRRANKMGILIELNSDPDFGTRWKLELPL